MLYWILGLSLILVVGALAAPGTLFRSFALGFDMFCQSLLWNAPIGVTISSRAGLAARAGNCRMARFINFIMLSDTHCEDSIAGDLERAEEARKILTTIL